MRARLFVVVTALFAAQACASLGQLGQLGRVVQPPQFEAGNAEVRLVGPSVGSPLGGATVRLWTRVRNPNPFGFTLSTVRATLILDDARAAEGDFPLGLPLQPGQESVVPLDLRISFADVPALANVLRRLSGSRSLPYRVDGTIGVDVGRLGAPTFGPMTLFAGNLDHP